MLNVPDAIFYYGIHKNSISRNYCLKYELISKLTLLCLKRIVFVVVHVDQPVHKRVNNVRCKKNIRGWERDLYGLWP